MRFCSIASGSSGNSIYIGSDNTHVLVDAGISAKRITEGLHGIDIDPSMLSGIFITHEHSDHIASIGVMSRKYEVPIYLTEGTYGEIRKKTGLGRMEPELFHIIKRDERLVVGDLNVRVVPVSHDAADPVAYTFENGGKSAGVLTDLGVYDENQVEAFSGLDVLLLEANHDVRMLQAGIYPYYLKNRILGDRGHLSNETSGQLLSKLLHDDMRRIFLGHLSKENNYPGLALQSVKNEIDFAPCTFGAEDFEITVAHREETTECIAF